MNIFFKEKKTQKVFNSDKLLKKVYGQQNAVLIKRRMAVLSAADNLDLVPKIKPERCHQLTGERKRQFAVDLKHPFRLVFKPNHDPVPLKPDGGIDIEKVTSIIILRVEDYH